MTEVVVVGAYNAGFTVYLARLPVPGETLGDGRFDWGPGGKGTNQAIALRRLGVDACLVTKIGADVFGEHARRVLVDEGLPDWGILTGSGPTGIAFILVQSDGENSIVVAPGVNLELDIADVRLLETQLASSRVVLVQLECRADLALGVARWARDSGKTCLLNPAPARPLAAGDLASFDLITPNETELASLAHHLGIGGPSLESQAMGLVELGVPDVVVTLGEEGALWASSAGTQRFGAYPAEVRDTTGAGDAFNAGLAAGIAEGLSMPDAIDLGCRAGAYCVTREGVIDGLASRATLDTFVRGSSPHLSPVPTIDTTDIKERAQAAHTSAAQPAASEER
jgi:ribokinase